VKREKTWLVSVIVIAVMALGLTLCCTTVEAQCPGGCPTGGCPGGVCLPPPVAVGGGCVGGGYTGGGCVGGSYQGSGCAGVRYVPAPRYVQPTYALPTPYYVQPTYVRPAYAPAYAPQRVFAPSISIGNGHGRFSGGCPTGGCPTGGCPSGGCPNCR
jgi:hypothetical protein